MLNRLKKIEWSRYTILYILVIFWIIMYATNPSFRSWTNLSNTLRQASLYGIISIGMAFCIISGSFDLSVGSMVAFIAVFGLSLINQLGFFGIIAFMLITGIILGLINGLLIAYLRISAVIVTLGTYYTFRAIVLIFTGGEGINFKVKWFTEIGNGDVFGIPIPFIIFVVFSILGAIVLHRTVFGRNVIALGNSEKASSVSGVNVKFTKLMIFSLLGLLSGITALLMSSRQWSANPSMAKNLHFDAITIVVLGGTKLTGAKVLY